MKGKRIALVYHDSPYGKEPIALLQKRGHKHGFETMFLSVTHPAVERKAWDGKKWNLASDWITPEVIAPMVKEAVAKYAAEKNMTNNELELMPPRDARMLRGRGLPLSCCRSAA